MNVPGALWPVLLRPGTGIQLERKVVDDDTEQWFGTIHIQRGDEFGRVAVRLMISALSAPPTYINDMAASPLRERNGEASHSK